MSALNLFFVIAVVAVITAVAGPVRRAIQELPAAQRILAVVGLSVAGTLVIVVGLFIFLGVTGQIPSDGGDGGDGLESSFALTAIAGVQELNQPGVLLTRVDGGDLFLEGTPAPKEEETQARQHGLVCVRPEGSIRRDGANEIAATLRDVDSSPLPGREILWSISGWAFGGRDMVSLTASSLTDDAGVATATFAFVGDDSGSPGGVFLQTSTVTATFKGDATHKPSSCEVQVLIESPLDLGSPE